MLGPVMLLSIVVACGIFAVLSLPGWILVAGTTDRAWVYLAAGFCSQIAVILLTALVSLVVPGQIPVTSALIVTLFLSAAAFVWRPRGAGRVLPAFDPWAFAVPVIATLVAGAITRAAISMDNGDLLVRSWFNADGFKHLGYVHTLAAFGLPARDIFGDGAPLAYYWFFHLIPALGAALHGDAAKALIASGLVQTFAFFMLVYGLVRAAGANGPWAALFTLIGWLSPSLDGLTALGLSHFNLAAAATQYNIEGVNAGLLNGSTLFRASLYLPQHQFMLAGLLSWGMLEIAYPSSQAKAVRILALAPIVSAGAVSILLGAACLIVYAAATIMNRDEPLWRCIGRIAVVVVLALCVPFLFGVVGMTPGDSGLDSPLAADRPWEANAGIRFLLALPGLVFVYWIALLGLVGLRRGWRERPLPDEKRRAFNFGLALAAVGLLGLLISSLVDHQRLVLEFQLRVSLLAWLGLTIAAAWLLEENKAGSQRLVAISKPAAVLILALGLATPILDAIWHGASAERWVVRIPKDDLAVLDAIERSTPRDALILQKPEPPYLLGGRDTWAPIVAGRTIITSYRSTHWHDQKREFDQTKAFFDGKGPLPPGQYDYIYLSRALDPKTYDLLLERLAAASGWQRSVCLPNACLFGRDQKSPG